MFRPRLAIDPGVTYDKKYCLRRRNCCSVSELVESSISETLYGTGKLWLAYVLTL